MNSISRHLVQNAVDAAIDQCWGTYDDVEIKDDYTGYAGAEACLAIVAPRNFDRYFFAAMAANSQEGAEAVFDLIRAVQFDNLGYDTIFYFNGVTLEG
ncbi:hypothetical protein [Microbispora sp. NPDC049125]|uniref:hypothetical protein n=1 Tax=Microbispora sp. NPDC049125 TaxID=3154929 RepID=UPI003467830A